VDDRRGTLVLVPTFFGADALRTVIVVGGMLLLLFRPTLSVPRVVASAATTVASASLGIYLTHFGVLPLSELGLPPAAVLAVALAVGIAATWALETSLRHVTRWRRQRARRLDAAGEVTPWPATAAKACCAGSWPAQAVADATDGVDQFGSAGRGELAA
jgi:hypothetical protein